MKALSAILSSIIAFTPLLIRADMVAIIGLLATISSIFADMNFFTMLLNSSINSCRQLFLLSYCCAFAARLALA